MVSMTKILRGGLVCAFHWRRCELAFGQGLSNGSIGGVVKDPTGTVVPDTKVEVSDRR